MQEIQSRKLCNLVPNYVKKYVIVQIFKPLPAEIRSLFPSEFEETELGWVPKGWSIVRTEDIALKIGMGPFGSNIKVSTFVNAGVPIISDQHLKALLLIDGG